MLSRVALRAIRPSSTSLRICHHTLPATALRIRTYADRPKRPPPPPPLGAGRPPPRATSSPPPPPLPSSTGQARQTSPGTSLPQDQTWKAQDGIKLGGPAGAAAGAAAGAGKQDLGPALNTSSDDPNAMPSSTSATESMSQPRSPATSAAMPSAANEANRREDVARMTTSVDGTRPQDASISQAPLDEEGKTQEPLAQKADVDEPTAGSIRDRVHDAQAKAENTPPPPESEAADPPPQQPLPDLRQGIPSTFDFEFGAGRNQQQQQQRDNIQSERPSEQQEGVDVTTTPPREDQREREQRDYDRSAYETSLDRRRAAMANWLYAGLLFSVLAGAFYLARPYDMRETAPSHLAPDDATGWSPRKLYARMRARLGSQVGYYTEPTFPKLLPDIPEAQRQPYTLVLSLEDLMIHSTWDRKHGYRTAKRPGIDYFIRYLSQYYELVLFTSVPLSIADPVIKKLDPYHFIMWPLGREATKYEGGEYVKDLSYLNRPLSKTIIIDTEKGHVKNQPENAIVLPKWSGDPKDAHTGDLVRLIPFLEYVATMSTDDVRPVLKSFEGSDIAAEFARREALAREKFLAQLHAERAKRPAFSIGSLASGLGVKNAGMMGGGMVLADGQSVAEGLAKGKMLSDQIREQGQKQYEAIERQIAEHGAQWLREEEEEQKRMMEVQMRDMKNAPGGWMAGVFGGGAKKE
ncbi:hypothetical protein BAUCODRAFT_30172 [Baudoinia panamericana UAMH 10762]|uniref:Mitochondrial import inner membrane translocase subunit TIM50 n=1 Tax=Baudoinia panamericana (strain UAMH 10762) TaxID=717646 RepID=M2LYI0_BAUPA|nr:uncharacterized protein BAUCODRAFT_30172 [Baudoinia panamericana UAMH 10762]EMC99767.1 hypothetical protein BAUCODRAFT_30172 [Baudoinia panamericana UAMH 10762]